ncbi:alpha/beta fold hydrolase [Fodinibacter luteus]|uniref:Alpha/beta fold hydrolase n=1 Tax=Fodinibacter luteus TaxID=552064 RepID=A0ABP8KD45_9MICO
MTVPVAHDGLLLPVHDEGPRDGEVVLLLHGFPQDASCWHAVVPHLHEAGLRTLAPDQRGYVPSARPEGRGGYDVDTLVGDALAVLDALGAGRAHVVGHDWGGVLAWHLAARHPHRLASATVLSTPHPGAYAEAMVRSLQPLRSWYTLAVQVPLLPELLLSRTLPAALRAGGLPERDAVRYAARLSSPGDLTGPLEWYRAAGRRALLLRSTDPGPVTVPTTYAWGRRDPALGRRAAERTRRHVRGPYRFVELDEGHWLPERRPGEVADAVLDRVRSTRRQTTPP